MNTLPFLFFNLKKGLLSSVSSLPCFSCPATRPHRSEPSPRIVSVCKMTKFAALGTWLCAAGVASASALLPARDYPSDSRLANCPGYKASNVKTSDTGLTADLALAGAACNAYGDDLQNLTLTVTYETGMIPMPAPAFPSANSRLI